MPPAQPTGWVDDGGAEGRGIVGVAALMLPAGDGLKVGLERTVFRREEVETASPSSDSSSSELVGESLLPSVPPFFKSVASESFESFSESFKADLEDLEFVLELVSSSSEPSESSESPLDVPLLPSLPFFVLVLDEVSSSYSASPLALVLPGL